MMAFRARRRLSIAGFALWLIASLLAAGTALAAAAPLGTETPWPLTVRSGDTKLTVYPIQLDRWTDGTLAGRSAVRADVGKDKPRTSYGVVQVEARALTDKGRRVVTLDDARVTRVEFPSVSAQEAQRFQKILAADFAKQKRTVAQDRLEAALQVAGETRHGAAAPLRHEAPRIVFSEVPALLVSIDGEPAFRDIGGGLQRVVNTRPMLARDASGHFHLHVFDGWMGAPALAGPWTVASATPALDQALRTAEQAGQVDPLSPPASGDKPAPTLRAQAPAIIVATTPTELVVFDGAPRYVPVPGTQLLYADNTTGSVFVHTTDNRIYVLVAGRWFVAPGQQGPWSYVAANALPPDFAHIPDESPKENVKASVAGTEQAREAAIAASVPQTALVKIEGTQMTKPRFDGDPVLKPVPSTTLQYVANTATPILWPGGSAPYYALENGVWFSGPSVLGPWRVATSVPAEIYAIPPTSPLYYVTFVRIYDVRDGVVYVGYTPGYHGTYIDPATGVVVYGTGYVYDPWLGTVWYGYPPTYGYAAAVTYTPWMGWAIGFGLGWWWGATTAGWGWGPYPWWGPWYPAYGGAIGPRGGAVAWGPGGWAGYSGNIYTHWGNRATTSRVAAGYDAWTGNAWAGRVGTSYNSRTGVASAGQRGAVANVYSGNYAAGGRGAAVGPHGGAVAGGRATVGNAYTGNQATINRGAAYNPNTGQVTHFGGVRGDQGAVGHVGDNVYAGHDGNVYRHTDGGGWEQHTAGGGWQPVAGSAQGEATRNATGGLGATRAGGTQQLDRENFARQQGAARTQALQRSSMGMNRQFGGGARMGGGMRMGGGFHRR